MIPRTYRILVADDHAVVRRGVRSLLESQPGLEVCAEAANGVETLACIKKEKPDLLILDLTMPEMNGLEVVQSVRQESPATDVLILTVHFSEELAREVLRSGALAYVLKTDADSDLLAAVDHVRHHQPYFTSQLAVSMANTFVRSPSAEPESLLPGAPLTAREIEIVQLLAGGKSNKETAVTLGISTRTVESHRNHIMQKMKFGSFSELVRFAIRHNLIDA